MTCTNAVQTDRRSVLLDAPDRAERTEPVAEFRDPFLASWITSQLGATERRLLILLHILDVGRDGSTSDRPADRLVDQMAPRGAHLIRHRHGSITGIWGLEQSRADDLSSAIAAASALDREGVACLLHAAEFDVPRASPADTFDAACVELGCLVRRLDRSRDIETGAGSILVTAAVRTVAGLDRVAVPVSTPLGAATTKALHLFRLTEDCATAGPTGQLSSDLDCAVLLDSQGDLAPLLRAAAIAGRTFNRGGLARTLDIDPQRLTAALDAASVAGLLCIEPGSILSKARFSRLGDIRANAQASDRFAFCHTGLYATAYRTVPPADRLRLHRRAASALTRPDTRSGETGSASEIARHHRLACEARQSRRWLSKAAWQAISRGDTALAVSYLEEALAQTEATDQSSLDRAMLQLLGVQLAMARGSGADAVFDAYIRSVQVAGQSKKLAWGQEFRSLWLAQTCHAVKGEIRAALGIGNVLVNQLNKRGEAAESTLGRRILAYRVQALSLMLNGQLQAALQHYDDVARHYRAEHHAVLRFAYGSDQLALTHAHRAWLFTIMGRDEDAKTAASAARSISDRLRHAHTSAHVMSVLAITALTRGSTGEAVLAAREARSAALENGFQYWVPWSDAVLAAAMARASPAQGYDALAVALERYRATESVQLCPAIHAWLSEAALAANQPRLALEQADAGLALVRGNACTLYQPELLRQRARAHRVLGNTDLADAALIQGFDLARQSNAGRFIRDIAATGMRDADRSRQIHWQARYHASLDLR